MLKKKDTGGYLLAIPLQKTITDALPQIDCTNCTYEFCTSTSNQVPKNQTDF
jgi:Na+-translocating ferredoxin:NAD+ oxidoreductase RNF subunit RnfB